MWGAGMSLLLSKDLSALNMPKDLPLLREAVAASQDSDELGSFYKALAEQHPVALVDLVIGPKAVKNVTAVRAALGVIGHLEQTAPPAAIYKRLLEVQEETRQEVIQVSAQRHPGAGWLVQISEIAEQRPGTAHLSASEMHPAFPAVCWAHATAGHWEALVQAGEMGRAEPAAALLAAGREGLAVEAAAHALAANPQCPLVPFLAAAGGPYIQPLLLQLVPRLQSIEAGQALQQAVLPFPQVASLLARVVPGMR